MSTRPITIRTSAGLPIFDVATGYSDGFVSIKLRKKFFGKRAAGALTNESILLYPDEARELAAALVKKAEGR